MSEMMEKIKEKFLAGRTVRNRDQILLFDNYRYNISIKRHGKATENTVSLCVIKGFDNPDSYRVVLIVLLNTAEIDECKYGGIQEAKFPETDAEF